MNRRIEVAPEMLAEGMKITFFGISTVFASMGIPDEAVKFLGIREPGKESLERNESPKADQNQAEERPVPYAAEASDDGLHGSGLKEIESRNTRLRDARPKATEPQNTEPQKTGMESTKSHDEESLQTSLDEIIRVIKRKIQDDPENSDRIRAILNNKYQKEKVQELTEESYETFLKEIRAL